MGIIVQSALLLALRKKSLHRFKSTFSTTQGNWRESATLILARPTPNTIEYLLTTRAAHSKFLAGSWCFPGGVFASIDSSHRWMDLFGKYEQFDKIAKFEYLDQGALKPDLYSSSQNNGALAKEVSLRLTGIRETFEECGILLCRSAAQAPSDLPFTKLPEAVAQEWQARVKSNPEEFLTLCENLEVLPCLEALYEWSNWLTPTTFKAGRSGTPRRFDTIFYVVILPSSSPRPNVFIDPDEVQEYMWSSAADLIQESTGNISKLLTPQLHEMGAIREVTSELELRNLIQTRQQVGIRRWSHHFQMATDGILGCLPGDDMFPEPYDFVQFEEMETVDKTLEELRKSVENLHRWEFGLDGLCALHANTREFRLRYPTRANITVMHDTNYSKTDLLRIFTNYSNK